MASASFTVNGAAVDGAVAVEESTTVDLAIASTVGVRTVSWSIVGNHSPDATNPTITSAGSPSGATASFAMPAGAGQAYLVQCQVNAGVDELNRPVAAQTFRAVVGVYNEAGLVPFACGETIERSSTHGWIEALNEMSAGWTSGSTPTADYLALNAQSSFPNPGPTKGVIGVKNTSTTSLQFTDSGNDVHKLTHSLATVAAGSPRNVDWSASIYQQITLTGNTTLTFTAPTGGPAWLTLRIVQDSTPRTVTWPTMKWPSGTPPTISTGSGAIDIVRVYYDGTTYYGEFKQAYA